VGLKVGVVASDRREWHVQRLMEELTGRGVEAYVFPATRFYSRVGSGPRVPGGTAEQVFYRMDVLHRLEDIGVYVINPADAIERAVDKYYTSTLLEDAGIRTPRTVVTESFDEAVGAFEELGGDVVVKPLFGSLGMGMTRISDPEVAYRVFRALNMAQNVYYLQEFVPHGNEDVRAFVVGGEVVASMLRTAVGWKTNISAGATAKPCALDDELLKLSVKATEAIGLDYSGVDILRSEKDGQHYVIELNSTPGWQGLQTVTERNITGAVVNFILGKRG
jgi:RimK family alpha-L-glutamate ligase